LGPAPSVGFFEKNARERYERLSVEHANYLTPLPAQNLFKPKVVISGQIRVANIEINFSAKLSWEPVRKS
jgi:hypothetical protein